MMHLPLIGIIGAAADGCFHYATLALAESSGDPWVDGDCIQITDGALFRFKEDLEVDGYSGLIHDEPYGLTLGELSTVTLIDSENVNIDPDLWVDWSDTSTGTKGVDYQLDTSGGVARLRDLTIPGRAQMISDNNVSASDTEAFFIIDRIVGVTTSTTVLQNTLLVHCLSFKDGSNAAFISLAGRLNIPDIVWFADTSAGLVSTDIRRDEEHRVFIYVKEGRWAMWFDGDAGPEISGTTTKTAGLPVTRAIIQAGDGNPDTGTSTLTLGRMVLGRMTTSI